MVNCGVTIFKYNFIEFDLSDYLSTLQYTEDVYEKDLAQALLLSKLDVEEKKVVGGFILWHTLEDYWKNTNKVPYTSEGWDIHI